MSIPEFIPLSIAWLFELFVSLAIEPTAEFTYGAWPGVTDSLTTNSLVSLGD